MKDYLKEDLSVEERTELKSIIWRVAKKHKLKVYAQQKRTVGLIENIDLPIEDNYNLDDFNLQSCGRNLHPLTEVEKTNIVNKMNMLMDELWLFELKRALTFNEKLMFFLLSVERYKGVEVMKLLSITKMTVYNRKKSIASKISKMIGGLSGGKKL